MKTISTLINGVTVTYPERFVYTRDNNWLKVARTSDTNALGDVNITFFPRAGVTAGPILSYTTSAPSIVFDLNNLCRAYVGATFAIRVRVAGAGGYIGGAAETTDETITIREGRTVPDRPHGGTRYVDRRVQAGNYNTFFFPRPATITAGNSSVNFAAGQTISAGDLAAWFRAAGGGAIAINYTDGQAQPPVDTFLSPDRGAEIIPLGEAGECLKDGITIVFTGADGDQRAVAAHLISVRDEVERVERVDYSSTARRVLSDLTAGAETWEVIIPSAPRKLYVEDILYSPDLYIVSRAPAALVPVALGSFETETRRRDDVTDYRLTLIVSK